MVHITSSDLQAVLPVDATLINGVGTFTVTLKTAGSQDIFATDNSIVGSTSVNVLAESASTNLIVTAPSTATAGVSFVVTVTAKDTFGNTVTGYTGTIHFTSTDNSAILPLDYTFQALDSGSKAFDGVIFETAGIQTVTATDTLTSSISGTTGDIIVSANADHPQYIIVNPQYQSNKRW